MNEPFSSPNPDNAQTKQELTDKEKALLAEAKPQTEAEALSLLAALAKLDIEAEAETSVETARPCAHIFQGKCQLRQAFVPNPLGCHCSRYE